jgi:hypothetical protein
MTKEGFKHLKFAYFVLLAGIAVCAFIIGGSYLYLKIEKDSNIRSQKTLNDMKARVSNIKRERDDLRDSEDTYKAITARGIFISEQRLDLIEAMRVLQTRHNLLSLQYELGNQRALKLAGGTALSGVEARGSRIQLRATAMHDGDMMAFLDEFPRLQRGFFPIDRCVLKQTSFREKSGGSGPPAVKAPVTDAPAAAPPSEVTNGVEAECTLEWITLFDKKVVPSMATPAAAVSR